MPSVITIDNITACGVANEHIAKDFSNAGFSAVVNAIAGEKLAAGGNGGSFAELAYFRNGVVPTVDTINGTVAGSDPGGSEEIRYFA